MGTLKKICGLRVYVLHKVSAGKGGREGETEQEQTLFKRSVAGIGRVLII